ncbi:MAG: hypothetical protein OEZ29_05885 [Candidatus Bathyarchaeota archaeon]|nr:hypothetical protein [Candidatus Bathyarchaeota archaeon]
MFELVGLGFQVPGIIVILIAQVVFYFRARKEYGLVKGFVKAFTDISTPSAGPGKKHSRKKIELKLKSFLGCFRFPGSF